MVKYELSDAQRAAAAAMNINMTNYITGGTTKLDEVPEVEIYEGSDGKEEPDPI